AQLGRRGGRGLRGGGRDLARAVVTQGSGGGGGHGRVLLGGQRKKERSVVETGRQSCRNTPTRPRSFSISSTKVSRSAGVSACIRSCIRRRWSGSTEARKSVARDVRRTR